EYIACTGAIASKLTPTVKSIPNQIVIFCLIGAELARDKAGRSSLQIASSLIAGKPSSHRICAMLDIGVKIVGSALAGERSLQAAYLHLQTVVPVGAELARDKAGRSSLQIASSHIAGKPGSYQTSLQ
ncbi:hypothetical protein QCD79_30665, partial [Pseudomonas quasicaspiana]|nr:hypothetical protein [Pseudomonas quasicaspiana]